MNAQAQTPTRHATSKWPVVLLALMLVLGAIASQPIALAADSTESAPSTDSVPSTAEVVRDLVEL
jgi:hypothetical protein